MTDGRVRRGSALRRYDWEAIAGIAAAGAALVLHLLHIIDVDVLLTIALVLLALLLFRDLRREVHDEAMAEWSERTNTRLEHIQLGLASPDVTLVGPRHLRPASVSFARDAHGEMIWFNVCLLMFKPQALFDALLRPALENESVTGVQFLLDESERERWTSEVVAKAETAGHAGKLRDPIWTPLKDEPVSFILAENGEGMTEAHLSFWGEPFMSRQPGFDVPRYVFHVHGHPELIPQLVEIERKARRQGF